MNTANGNMGALMKSPENMHYLNMLEKFRIFISSIFLFLEKSVIFNTTVIN